MNKKNEHNASLDPITGLILESDSYREFDQIEKLVENKNDLSVLPVQPIYLALKSMAIERVAELLPRFSKEQRQTFLDIDLWQKDEIDLMHFPFWLLAYQLVENEEVKAEFVKSEQFILYLKGKFNIWTFDVEDPEYPDHDNYFLTDDSLLLFEFDENFPLVQEVRELVRFLYSELGVEGAYTFLFKLVSDSFLIFQEEEFQKRSDRLRDFGFVNYIDALEIENPFIGLDFLNKYIKDKKVYHVNLDAHSKNQNIHNSALVSFKDHFKTVIEELLKVKDQDRLDYLQFNFVRLINSRLEYTNALKKGSVAMSRSGAHTKNIIQLGFSYLKSEAAKNYLNEVSENGIFEKFDFTELYRMGNSLLIFNKKALKKALANNSFDKDESESFLGEFWTSFLDESFDIPVKFQPPMATKSEAIIDYQIYEMWTYKSKTLMDLLPFAKKFYDTFLTLKSEGRLQDSYYLNYTVESINLETLLISSFANFFLGTFDEKNTFKLGLTLDEYKNFATKIVTSEGKFVLSPEIFQKIQFFIKSYGLENVFDINNYIQELIKTNLEGYDFSELSDEEFQHVGGPIILAIVKH